MTVPCSLIQYMTERLESKDRWVGALQQSEVARILINGPADPISGAHAAEGFASLGCTTGLPHCCWYPSSRQHASCIVSAESQTPICYRISCCSLLQLSALRSCASAKRGPDAPCLSTGGRIKHMLAANA